MACGGEWPLPEQGTPLDGIAAHDRRSDVDRRLMDDGLLLKRRHLQEEQVLLLYDVPFVRTLHLVCSCIGLSQLAYVLCVGSQKILALIFKIIVLLEVLRLLPVMCSAPPLLAVGGVLDCQRRPGRRKQMLSALRPR